MITGHSRSLVLLRTVRRAAYRSLVVLSSSVHLCIAAGGEALPTPEAVARLVAVQEPRTESRPWKYIVLHHSATGSGSVASIDEAHRQRLDEEGLPWRGIGYHFVIGNGEGMADGELAATFRWREQCEGAHAGIAQFNELGVGVCLIGDFNATPPSPQQLATLQALIVTLQREYGIDDDRILAHRDVRPTACPGSLFPLATIRGENPGEAKRTDSGD